MTRRELLAALGVLLSGCGPSERQPMGSLRDYSFDRIDTSAPEPMSAYRGRVVLLNVWAVWCPPCRAEMPSLQRLSQRLPADRFAVLGLSTDADALRVREFLRSLNVDFARHIDPAGGILRNAIKLDAYPLNLVLDAEANIRWMEAGYRDWDNVDGAGWLTLAAAGRA